MRNGNDSNRRAFLRSACFSLGAARILSAGSAEKKAGNLVQRLGYAADARVIIITADEFGECHAANMGIARCWEAGLLKSVTWVAPGPWAPEAAEYVRNHPGMDVGVHLTLAMGSVSGIGYRPVLSHAEAPGLHTPDGYLWPDGVEAWKHTTADEIKRESRAQIEKAIRMGIDPTHLDPHDGIFNFPRGASPGNHLTEFAKLYADLAKEFSLPVRLSYTRAQLAALGRQDIPKMFSGAGVLSNDEGMMSQGQISYFRKAFRERAPGTVTEMYIHPVVPGPEAEAVRIQKGWWKIGVEDLRLFTTDRDQIQQAIEDEGLIVIGWRQIRELQRHGG